MASLLLNLLERNLPKSWLPGTDPNGDDPLSRLASLEKPKTIHALKVRFGERQRAEHPGSDLVGTYEALVQDALYQEGLRLKDEHPSRTRDRDKAFWREVKQRMSSGSPEVFEALCMDIVGHFTSEIHGNFSPPVYHMTTAVVPRALGLLTTGLSPRVLRRYTPNALKLLTSPGTDSLREFMQQLPTFDTQLIVQGEVETLRSLSTKGTVMLVPTHVSNLDSVVMGWAIHKMGLPPFTYGAGLNLFTNPFISFFMHNLGAYTVDRRKKSRLYKDTLKLYSTYILEKGLHSLFFPGGTRARSGQYETHLKLGLMGTGLDAFIANIQRKKHQPNVYIVPCTLNYQVVLEAETLIDDYLKGVGKSRYIIVDDEFSQLDKWVRFLTNLLSLDSKVFLTISEPLDPFGNRVTPEGISVDPKGRAIDTTRYIMKNGYPDYLPQRDQEYTRELGRAIEESYARDNVVLSTNLVCITVFTLMERLYPGEDLYHILRRSWRETPLDFREVVETLDRAVVYAKKLEEQGKVRVSRQVRTLGARELIERAMQVLGGYHTRQCLETEGKWLIPADPALVFYYSNRARGYGFEEVLGLAGDCTAARSREVSA